MAAWEWLKVILLGLVEGVTEWLPISSTGHLILVGELLKLNVSDSFMEMFNVVIQLGAILAVVVLYFHRLWPFHTKKKAPAVSPFAHPAQGGPAGAFQGFATHYLYLDKIVMWLKIALSCLPGLVIGLPLDNWLEAHMHRPLPVAAMLILYGVIFLVVEETRRGKRPRLTRISQISWKDALLVGCFQALAIVPGTSRSGATIIGGMVMGMSRTLAAEYTFYLAIPTMLGASAIKLIKFGLHFTGTEAAILVVGMLVAFLVSLVAIKFLMSYIKRHDFKVFGWYRIILGLLVLVLFAAGLVKG